MSNNSDIQTCTCPEKNPEAHWEDRDMDGYEDTFIEAESPEEHSDTLPTEEQVLQTIFDCVFIRGIELEDYKHNFSNEQSGLYDALVKLFNNKPAQS